MKIIRMCLWVALAALSLVSCSGDYMDASLPVEKRVSLLMKQMTIEEMISQMDECCLWDEDSIIAGKMNEGPGFGAWLGEVSPEHYNELQALSEKSRLKIPYLFGCDCPHGHAAMYGRTVFPTSISMAATFNPDLVYDCAVEAAKEIRATGTDWTMSPSVDIVWDARWGRTGETYGECPFLTSRLVEANVRGLQGDLGPENVAVAVKHLYGGGTSIGGVNHGNAEISERTARNIFLRPFKAAVDAGACTIMPGHNDVNGIPCHSNKWLLTDLVRNEWGFKGFYISDMGDVENLKTSNIHRVAADQKEAVLLAVNAGLDMHMYSSSRADFQVLVKELYDEGKVSKTTIKDACARILNLKFRLGLFENRYIDDPVRNDTLYGGRRALDLALEAARQNVVLLKNDNGILPLDTKKYRRILITGPNADNHSILGDWSNPQPEENVVTIKEGLEKELEGALFTYVNVGRIKGEVSDVKVNTTDPATQSKYLESGGEINDVAISNAVAAARKNDIAIIVIGGYGCRYDWGLRTYGESADRPSIDFYGRQVELVKRIAETGIPYIVVIINGKPLNNTWVTEHSAAMLDAWEPGLFGGQAVGEIIAGKVNPSGHLPITIPKDAGQVPMFYYQTKSRYTTGYGIGSSRSDDSPEFCFGHGLSYTTFEVHDAAPSDTTVLANKDHVLRLTMENTGKVAGYQTAMAFLTDEKTSVVTPYSMLCGFKKVWLEPGERKDIEITVPFDSFKLWNEDMEYVAEAGEFTLRVGFSFDDIRIVKKLLL